MSSRKPAPDVASKEKNEYIPSFITKKPFWVPDDEDAPANDYLEHQRLHSKESSEHSKWYDRGRLKGPVATKYRKGACENCGAITHKTKECLSRPRKAGARWTGKDIQADEAIQQVNLGWDAKRDRWNGYDTSEYRSVVDEYEELERLKKRAKLQDAEETNSSVDNTSAGNQDARYAEESDMGRQQSTATRNLRLREDTAKYLLNLDLDSAKYDPKSRSMVDMGAQTDQAAAFVAEDNFMRASGDAAEFEKAQKYAWESQERGGTNKQHIQANPTSGEYHRRIEAEEAALKKEARKQKLFEKYGGGEHVTAAPVRNATIVESDRYIEYDDLGGVKGASKLNTKSKYAENILINNHGSVWGSWWKDFQWGYACCHSTVKNSWCAGEEGKKALEDANNFRSGSNLIADDLIDAEESLNSAPDARRPLKSNSIKSQQQSNKKKLAEGVNVEITEKDMEAYKRSKHQAGDPMAKMLGKDELVQ